MSSAPMSPDRPELERKYRQPRVFGALPGPRNVPLDKRNLPDNMTVLTVAASALTDAAALGELLPPRCRLHGDPVLTVSIAYLRNIGWLAGRGYNIVSVEFPIVFDGEEGRLTGKFTPVLWESLADPILTGREELGFSKLYAQIPERIILGNAYRASASWEGFRFFELEASDLAETAENRYVGARWQLPLSLHAEGRRARRGRCRIHGLHSRRQ